MFSVECLKFRGKNSCFQHNSMICIFSNHHVQILQKKSANFSISIRQQRFFLFYYTCSVCCCVVPHRQVMLYVKRGSFCHVLRSLQSYSQLPRAQQCDVLPRTATNSNWTRKNLIAFTNSNLNSKKWFFWTPIKLFEFIKKKFKN